MSYFTPRQIVFELDKYIIGQKNAKIAIAVALRNRWRRMILKEPLRHEVTPKNILMIGPTGVGKTEIARRLAKLVNAPFLKVEATKFTEVGYVGKEIDSIIRDLTEVAIKMLRKQLIEHNRLRARIIAENIILESLMKQYNLCKNIDNYNNLSEINKLRNLLRIGRLNDKEIEIEIEINVSSPMGIEIMTFPGMPVMEDITYQLQNVFKNMYGKKRKLRIMTIQKAIKLIIEEEAAKLINPEDLTDKSIKAVEQHGIVFIDEIDKICKKGEISGGLDVSREGVQRDLLPLIEGCTVYTKYGVVKTDHILFIASGAFQLTNPSDLIPELQGRLPIRVELDILTPEDYEKILTEPNYSLITQYIALMATEGINLTFTKDGIKLIAEAAWKVNESLENIGARRLHTVLERLLEDISYKASEFKGKTIIINSNYVRIHLANFMYEENLSKFIL